MRILLLLFLASCVSSKESMESRIYKEYLILNKNAWQIINAERMGLGQLRAGDSFTLNEDRHFLMFPNDSIEPIPLHKDATRLIQKGSSITVDKVYGKTYVFNFHELIPPSKALFPMTILSLINKVPMNCSLIKTKNCM